LDTKSKKLSSRFAARLTAFILVVALTAGAAAFALVGYGKVAEQYLPGGSMNIVGTGEIFSDKPYIESDTFQSNFTMGFTNAMYFYKNYGGFDPTSKSYGTKTDPNIMKEYEDVIKNMYNGIVENIVIGGYLNEQVLIDGVPVDSDLPYGETGLLEYAYNDDAADVIFEFGKMQSDSVVSTFFKKAAEGSEVFDNEDGTTSEKFNWIAADFEAPGVKEAFEKVYAKELKQVLESIVDGRVEEYEQYTARLEDSGASYYIGDGKTFITNVKLDKANYPADMAALTSSPAHLEFAKGELTVAPESMRDTMEMHVADSGLENVSMFFSYDKNSLATQASAMTQMRDAILTYGGLALGALLLALIFFIILLVWTGRKREDGTRKLYALDKVFVEVQAVIILLAAFITAYGFYGIIDGVPRGSFMAASCAGVIALGMTVVLWCLLSIVRNLKAGLFVKRSIICAVFRGVKSLALIVKPGFDGTNPFAKTILLVALLIFVSAICGGIIIARVSFYGYLFADSAIIALIFLIGIAALAFVFTAQRIKKYGKLKQGVEEIARGNISFRIEVDENDHSEFAELSRRVNEIGYATNIAVQNELKNQRLKTDLISNVSHDLKTPLTSIITYTDLLKKEGLRGKNAPEYLNIIDEKGRRLQKLTEDLFDAAKASSGAVHVQREKLDLLSLLNQEIAEMANGLAVAELDVIVNGGNFGAGEAAENRDVATHCYVLADSRLLWRVVDNLLANVRKYSLPGSRVYIDVREQNASGAANGQRGMIVMEMKNISKVKLNIPADELMERFKRGDESRTTEGSGLGLAIAKDLVRLQGGRFEISIDGDLFKTVTMLEPYAE
jgi:signal transduction histidine kinase